MSDTQQLLGMEKQRGASPFVPERFKTRLLALTAGLVAALVSVVCMLALRLGAGIPTPVELFGDFILKHLPADRFVAMLILFSPNSKLAPLGLTLLAMIVLGCLLGLLYARLLALPGPLERLQPTRREWLIMLLLGGMMSLLGTVLFWNESPQNFLGLPPGWAHLCAVLALLVDFLLYALVLGWSYRWLLFRRPSEAKQGPERGRRSLLARAGVAALGVGAGGGMVGLLREYVGDYAAYDGSETFSSHNMTLPITPTSQHYTVTQNPIDPTPDLHIWRLEVTGLVATGGTYTYEEFTSLPSTSRAITLECIANAVGGHLISTAIWQGVPLRTVLERHGGAQPGARYVIFSSVDGYTVSLPLDEVLAVDTLLAFRMNGGELPQRHGYPVRVLVPGRYGEENPKWLTRIELSDQAVGGLYADQGWYNGPLHTITRIDRPYGHTAFASTIEIGGMAFAGSRGIEHVEISVDNGVTWQDAQLDPPLSQDAWVLWTYQWHPTARGAYTVQARAVDGTGQLQTSQQQGTVPNGATGYAHVSIMLS